MTVTPDKIAAGSIKLEKIEMVSEITNETVDLRSIVTEFSIYESLDKSFLTANLLIEDALSLFTTFPIVGREIVTIKFKTPHQSILKEINVKFRVTRIADMIKTGHRSATYTLVLASEELITNENTKISKSYRGQIDTAVNDIVTNILKSQKNLEITATDGDRVMVIPNMHPARALKFLAKEAYSSIYTPSNFVFYESCDGFHFKTIEEMIKDKGTGITGRSGRPRDTYYASDKDTPTPSSAGGRGIGNSKPFELQKITDIKFLNVFAHDKMLAAGGYENRIMHINPMISLYETSTYDYFNNFGDLAHTTISTAGKFLTPNSGIIKGTGQAFENYYVTNKGTQTEPQEQKHEFLHLMVASQALLNGVLLKITIPGDTDRRVGDTIRIEIPEMGGTDDILGKRNKFLSGEYLITAIRHMYNGGGYNCVMHVSKNCYERDIDVGNS